MSVLDQRYTIVSRKQIAALLSAHVLLFGLAFQTVLLWPLILLAGVPLIRVALHAQSTRGAMTAVAIAHLPLWLWINFWVKDVTFVGYPLFAVYMILNAMLFVWAIRRASRHRILGRVPMSVLVPITWVAVECLRGEVIFHGYPWYFAAHPVIEWPVMAQSADLFGSYFVSFLVAMLWGACTDVWMARTGAVGKRTAIVASLLTLTLHAANSGYGIWRLSEDTATSGPTVLTIQTNLLQDNKIAWTAEQQVEDFESFERQTYNAVEAARQRGESIDLIVWPETMVPGIGFENESLSILAEHDLFPGNRLQHLSALARCAMLVGSAAYEFRIEEVLDEQGAPRLQRRWDRRFNAAYLIQGSPPFQRYDKHVLTPFGETMPYVEAWPWLEKKFLSIGAQGMSFDLDPSETIQRISYQWPAGGGAMMIATPICFEDTIPWLCRRMVYPDGEKVVQLLINLSNDGWFGASTSARRQHAQAARYRCIENRVPMIRAANTGFSTAIDANGKLIAIIGDGRYGTARQAGSMLTEIPLDWRSTLYGRVGDVWAWGCLGLAAAALLWTLVPPLGAR